MLRNGGDGLQVSRTLNSVRNIIWAIINKVAIIIMPFVVRTVMIYKLGAEYTGLSSLFTSILTMLSLAELGFSNAMVYCMYEPIHNGNNQIICALIKLYKKIYTYIGIIILVIGLILLPFLPSLIKGTIPENINIYYLYLIYLSNTVISYFLFAYKSSLLTAYQRNDLISVISLCCNMVMYALQIVVLLLMKNFYMYAILIPVSTVAMNLLYEKTSRKFFPKIVCKGEVSAELKGKIKKRVIGIMLYKFSSTTRTSFDSVIISAFLGLILLTQYQNYFMIISSVLGMFTVISNAITASIGDSIVAKSVDDNYHDFKKFVFVYMWVAGFCAICLLVLIQPFMKMWVGEGLMLDFKMAMLFAIYFYAQTMGDMVFLYRTAAGLWWQDRIRPIVEAAVNIVLNFILVIAWGIHGVILATIFTLLGINFLWGAYILFKHYFKRNIKEYVWMQVKQALVTIVSGAIILAICKWLPDSLGMFVVRLLLCIGGSNIIFYIFYRRSTLFKEATSFGVNIVKVIKKRT